MTSDVGPGGGDLFDEAVVTAYLDDVTHVERPWLQQAAAAALEDPHCRFLLLTGAPGGGKSAFMAWMARKYPDSLRYFLRRDSITPHRSGDVYTMLESLGHQLAVRRPEAFQPSTLAVVIEQQVGEVRAGGSVVGARVEELVGSPFYATAVRVTQRFGSVAGDVRGMEIGRVVTDIRAYPWQELDRIALSGPAEVVAADDPSARVIVLIDALDEAEARGGADIMDWLASRPVLPASLRVVVASRPGEFLEPLRNAQRACLHEIRIDGAREESGADIRRFLEAESSQPPLAPALKHARIERRDFCDRIVRQAAGNFQYAVAVVRGAAAWSAEQQDEAFLSALSAADGARDAPSSLTDLYGVFTAELRRRTRRRTVRARGGAGHGNLWDEGVRPALAVLALCREPLSAAQIARYSTAPVDDETLGAALAELAPLLDATDGGLRLYHASLAEAVTRRGPRTPGISSPGGIVDPVDSHLRLAGFADPPIGAGPPLLPDDEYRWRNAVPHLFAAAALAGSRQRGDLLGLSALLLGSFDYLYGRITYSGVDGALFDLRTARSADESVFVSLRDLELLLDKIAGELRAAGVPRTVHEFVQLLLHRAAHHGTPSVTQAARAWFHEREHGYLDVVWLRGGVSRALVGSFAIHTGPVARLLALPQDRAVSAGSDGRVALWDVSAGEPVWSVLAHSAGAADVAVCGRVLVTACPDEPSQVIDLEDGQIRARLGDTGACLAAAVDDEHIVTAGGNGLLQVWNIPLLRGVAQYRASFASAPTALSVVGRTVWAAFGMTIVGWDVRTGQPAAPLEMGGPPSEPPTDMIVALLPVDGDVIAVTRRGLVGRSVGEPGKMRQYRPLSPHGAGIAAAGVVAQALIAASDTKILLGELRPAPDSADEPHADPVDQDAFGLNGHKGRVTAVVAGTRRILSADALGAVNIWDLESATQRLEGGNSLQARSPLPRSLAANLEWIVQSGRDLTLWDATTQGRGWGTLYDNYSPGMKDGWGDCRQAYITPEGWLAAYFPGGYGYEHRKKGWQHAKNPYTIQIWFVPGRHLRHALPIYDEVTALLLTPQGRLVTGHPDGSIAVWAGHPNATGIETARNWYRSYREGIGAAQHPTPINILFYIDDRRLISGSEDGLLQIWERDPPSHKWRARPAEGSPHGTRITGISRVSLNRLATVDASGTAAVWNEDMTQAEPTYQFPTPQPHLAGNFLAVRHGNTLQIISVQHREPAAALRLPAAISGIRVLDRRTLLVDDKQGNQLCLTWTDPYSPAPSGHPATGPQDRNSLYRWPSLWRRIRYSGPAVAAIIAIEAYGGGSLSDRIVFPIFPGGLIIALFIAAILNRPGDRRHPKKLTARGTLGGGSAGLFGPKHAPRRRIRRLPRAGITELTRRRR